MATTKKRNIQRRVSSTGDVSWRVQIRRKGYPNKIQTFDTEQAADDFVYDTERDIRDRRVDPQALAERKSVTTAIDLYLNKVKHTHKSYKDTEARCNFFKDKLGNVALADLNPVMIDEALDALACSGPTQNRYLGSFSGCLGFVSRTPYTWISVNPCKAVTRRKENKARERVLTPKEWKAIVAQASVLAKKSSKTREQQLPTYLRLAYATGRRRGELLGLRWDCVDLDAGLLYLLDTKTGDDQVSPLDDDTVAVLKKHAADFQVELWPYVFKGRLRDRPTDFDDLIRPILRDVCPPDRKGEVPVLHSVRHTVATELGNAGATEAQIMSVTGHKSSASVNRYVKKTVEAARAAQALRGSS